MLNKIANRLLLIGAMVVVCITSLCWLVNGMAHAEADVILTVCPSGPPACQFNSIQDALDSTRFAAEVRIAQGTYTDMRARPRQDVTTTGTVTQMVYINDKYVILHGGYTITDFVHAYPITQPTLLDAHYQGRVIYAANRADVTVEGLHILHGDTGYAFGSDGIAAAGGGIAAFNARLTLRNNHVEGNRIFIWGGGVFLQDTESVIEGNVFLLNTTGGRGASGGALTIFGGTSLISANQFISNSSWGAGGLYLGGVTATLQSNTIISNLAATGGGGIAIGGGQVSVKNNIVRGNRSWAHYGPLGNAGISVQQSVFTATGNLITGNVIEKLPYSQLGAAGIGLQIVSSNAYLDYNTVSNNRVEDNAELFVAGGGLYANDSTLKLNHNLIANNMASTGGGIYLSESTAVTSPNAVFDANSIVDNQAYYGAGIYLIGPSLTRFANTVIADNRIINMPITASFLFARPTVDPTGSAVFLEGSPLQMVHGTIDHNTGGDGSAVAGTGSITLSNTILVRHAIGINLPLGFSAMLQSTLWGNTRNISGSATILANGNVFGDPAFVDAAAHNYHLQAGSIAIDRGVISDVFTDIDGDPRPIGPKPDIGVDEYLASLPTATPTATARPTATATPSSSPSPSPTPSPTGTPGPTSTSSPSPTPSPTPLSTSSLLTITLDAMPNSKQNFRFQSPVGNFKLDDAMPNDGDNVSGSKTFSVTPGTYVFTVEVPYSWNLSNIQCNPSDGLAVDLHGGQLVIRMQANRNVTCTVSMARSGYVLARVWDDQNGNGNISEGEPPLADWRVDLSEQSEPASPSRVIQTNRQGQANFGNELPARYKVCEQVQAGWRDTRPITLDSNGQPCYGFTLAPGKIVKAWFGNQRLTSAALEQAGLGDTPEISDRPEVPFDEAGYDGQTYDDSGNTDLYLPMVMR